MNKIYSILLLFILPLISAGQISLDATMAPPLNSMLIYYDANVPSPPFVFGTSGTSNTWDFSAITTFPGEEDTVFYFSPSAYPEASAFPSATHATYEGGDNSVNILSIDASAITFLGLVGDPIGTGTTQALPLHPPVTAMTFPYTYGSSDNASTYIEIFTTGAAIGQPTVDSVHYKGTLIISAEVIASGDMILPSGTIPSLLERQIKTSIDSAWVKGLITGNQWIAAPSFPTSSQDSAFYWYSDQSLEHYAHALYDSSGLHDVHFFKEQVMVGVNEVAGRTKQLNVFPNPTHDFLGINGLNFPASEWSIFNSQGSEVLKGNFNLGKLNVENLKQGTYLLKLKTVNGEIHQVKFIKN
jgi:hypothetical protein